MNSRLNELPFDSVALATGIFGVVVAAVLAMAI